MEGLRCPICNAISLVGFINDGEIYTCPYCKAKFTVTTVRRFYLHPHGKVKDDKQNYDDFIKYLSYPKLIALLNAISIEILNRYPNKDNKMG